MNTIYPHIDDFNNKTTRIIMFIENIRFLILNNGFIIHCIGIS